MARNSRQRYASGTHPDRPDPRKEMRKENAKKNASKSKSEISEGCSLVFPAGDTAFKALLSARFCAAIWYHVADCDETYNYWEPLHYLIYGKGLQTWEYSPEFALRSYAYLLLHALPAYIYDKFIQPNPLLIFYLVRCLLGLMSALSEVYFYKSVCREFGVNVGRLTFVFQLFAAGMFISSATFLPSSWAMYASSAAFAAWWQRRYPLAIHFVAISSLLGWPFAALLGIPIVFDLVVMQFQIKEFIQWTFISGVIILGPMIALDSGYYGTLVIAPLNIIKYNIFTNHGPDLYGTEPFSFYLINGFLNFNIIWILALITPILLVFAYYFIPARSRGNYSMPYSLSLSPLYLWLIVFFLQPHKEERFLFPIYPMICLCGAISVDVIQKLWFRVLSYFKSFPPGTHYLDKSSFIMFSAMGIATIFGLARTLALYQNYHAPLDLMLELNRFPQKNTVPESMEVNVCFGKDWHRYPSSFFLPNTQWNVRFIKSEFQGMLPFPYSGSDNATMIVHDHFNDQNKEDSRVYFDASKCNFLLDLDLGNGNGSKLEPNYSSQKNKWTVLKSLPFANVDRSHRFFRAFYIPFLNDKYVTYGEFYLLQAVKQKQSNIVR